MFYFVTTNERKIVRRVRATILHSYGTKKYTRYISWKIYVTPRETSRLIRDHHFHNSIPLKDGRSGLRSIRTETGVWFAGCVNRFQN